MKICAIICEYNPLHNGHVYHITEARKRSGADALVCIMSGNFVQRGECAVMDKYTRAQHAVKAGADAVIELPTAFATSNAELFAKGALHIIASIPAIDTLSFGAECADKRAFKSATRYLINEPKEVSLQIKQALSKGTSYAQARANAFAGFIPLEFLSSPNNILGLEYTKAILSQNANIDILPIQRLGAEYADLNLRKEFSSASAIREAYKKGIPLGDNVPQYVQNDWLSPMPTDLDMLEKYAVLSHSTDEIKRVCDCTEGLENAFKKAIEVNAPLVETLTSPRYTASRIRRIALQNLLKIEERNIREYLQAPLYLKILAIKKRRTDLLTALSESAFPILARAHDENKLSATALQCYKTDVFAEKLYSLISKQPIATQPIFIE